MIKESYRESAIWMIRQWESEEHYLSGENPVVKFIDSNVLLDDGANEIWTLVVGGGTPFNAVNTQIGVGDSSTPTSQTQTGLLGSNTFYKGLDANYPVYGSNREIMFKATFGATEANFAWNEFTVTNGAIALNRSVQSIGTKSTGAIWDLTLIAKFN